MYEKITYLLEMLAEVNCLNQFVESVIDISKMIFRQLVHNWKNGLVF